MHQINTMGFNEQKLDIGASGTSGVSVLLHAMEGQDDEIGIVRSHHRIVSRALVMTVRGVPVMNSHVCLVSTFVNNRYNSRLVTTCELDLATGKEWTKYAMAKCLVLSAGSRMPVSSIYVWYRK